MATAFDALFADSAVPVLQAWHGESVSRWPKGKSGAAVSVVVMWELIEPQREGSPESQGTMFPVVIQAPESDDYNAADVWVKDDKAYQTVTIGKPEGGLQTITAQRVEQTSTSRHNRSNML